MPYVRRDPSGAIAEICDKPEPDAMEYLETEDPEILRFLSRREASADIRDQLTMTDADMARVVEDLIDALLKKGVLMAGDLPDAVHAKLRRRRLLRRTIGGLRRLVAEEE